MIKANCDIICLSLSRWDAPISSPALSLAKEFAKKNRVFYIDHPFSWKDFIREKNTAPVRSRKKALLRGKEIYRHPEGFPEKFTVVTTPLVYPINFLPPGKVYNWFSRINDDIIVKTLRTVIRENSIREYIFINFFDPYFLRNIPDDIKPLCAVYQSMDDIAEVGYTRRHGVKLENEVIRKSDITLCTSLALTKAKSSVSPEVYYHPNAADTAIFRKAFEETLPRPADMPAGDKRIIGFTGSIEYRTDFALLKKVAQYHHDKILFFVGPVQGNEHTRSGFDKMQNVMFAGPKNINELPAYLQYFDCAIIPYKINKLTNSIYPLKINEYLAAGKPVVATHFSEDIYSFREVAFVVKTAPEFCRAIDRAIFEDNAQKKRERSEMAERHTWAKRVEQFWEIIGKKH